MDKLNLKLLDILKISLLVYKKNYKLLLPITSVCVLPLLILLLILPYESLIQYHNISLVFLGVSFLFSYLGVFSVVKNYIKNNKNTFANILEFTFTSFPRGLIVLLLINLILVICTSLSVGLFFLILIFFSPYFIFILNNVSLRKIRVFPAIKYSVILGQGHFWKIFVITIISTLINFGIPYLLLNLIAITPIVLLPQIIFDSMSAFIQLVFYIYWCINYSVLFLHLDTIKNDNLESAG